MYKTIKIGRIKTSRIELVDIAKAWLAISLAFAFFLSGTSLVEGNISNAFSYQFLISFLISLFTVGVGFLFHELAHKFLAQHYGCVAEFRAEDKMLYFAIGLAVFIGRIFAAPGAVIISGQITQKENGIISLAGPLTNYVLAIVFFSLNFVFPSFINVWFVGYYVNLFLGLFNLIPFWLFDGKKIFYWSKTIWIIMLALGFLGIYFRNLLF
ncbi:metalloprotease [Candidatus Woesearchaeota archaeon]|jgi:Zn-dependent protease|nr:metalloprotease [Candidatus Woesearchaeota archaeon]MBT4111215.1 metalloprotease [Candidatus Woesearchaeota archaeon]MBT4336795.1 metalloprotease [Candidatus Woesearchaeota archaeon]MBT4469463.1 metalloprotease [Candidatus Woesearchaeota archaeon]MBT6744142.1 metalloprotease [Candidatus Woesearchaeota archaeon]